MFVVFFKSFLSRILPFSASLANFLVKSFRSLSSAKYPKKNSSLSSCNYSRPHILKRVQGRMFTAPDRETCTTGDACVSGRLTRITYPTSLSTTIPKIFFCLAYSPLPYPCLLYTSPSPRDLSTSRMPSSA